MSDTFDHEGDAWSDFDRDFDRDFEEGFRYGYYSIRTSSKPQYRRPICRECKTTCDWHHTGERWLLFANGKPHKCDISNQFEDCDDATTT